jgi:hypothetical protein
VTIISKRKNENKRYTQGIPRGNEINLKHGVLISVYPISEEDYSTINSPLLINVRREGVPA